LADATVRAAQPTKNFGSLGALQADAGPALESYLKFDVRGLSGPVKRAVLRLYVTNGSADGPFVLTTTSAWTESGKNGITWRNRPPSGVTLADGDRLAAKAWVDYDVTAAVAGNGAVSFVLATQSKDGTDFASRQNSSKRPQLLITT
jgi:hypothetical protein